MTSESVRGHHDENFEWSQAEPLSENERVRSFLRFLDFFCKESARKNRKSKFRFLTSESVRGHQDENFEWSQAEPLSKNERARAFLRFLDFSARNLQGKTEIQISDF